LAYSSRCKKRKDEEVGSLVMVVNSGCGKANEVVERVMLDD
jgi:hypothetical protein